MRTLAELQKLDIDRYPNAAGALIRVVIELAVTEVHVRKSWQTKELRLMVKKCVHTLDPTDKNAKYQAVRAGLNDGTSVLAVSTIHAFLHNPHFHPSPTELRTIASNYAGFLAELDTLV